MKLNITLYSKQHSLWGYVINLPIGSHVLFWSCSWKLEWSPQTPLSSIPKQWCLNMHLKVRLLEQMSCLHFVLIPFSWCCHSQGCNLWHWHETSLYFFAPLKSKTVCPQHRHVQISLHIGSQLTDSFLSSVWKQPSLLIAAYHTGKYWPVVTSHQIHRLESDLSGKARVFLTCQWLQWKQQLQVTAKKDLELLGFTPL